MMVSRHKVEDFMQIESGVREDWKCCDMMLQKESLENLKECETKDWSRGKIEFGKSTSQPNPVFICKQ